jgi:hypothetical protein
VYRTKINSVAIEYSNKIIVLAGKLMKWLPILYLSIDSKIFGEVMIAFANFNLSLHGTK